MPKARKPAKTVRIAGRPARAKVSAAEAVQRMERFPLRKENFVAAIRKGKNRSVSA